MQWFIHWHKIRVEKTSGGGSGGGGGGSRFLRPFHVCRHLRQFKIVFNFTSQIKYLVWEWTNYFFFHMLHLCLFYSPINHRWPQYQFIACKNLVNTCVLWYVRKLDSPTDTQEGLIHKLGCSKGSLNLFDMRKWNSLTHHFMGLIK